MHLSFSFPICHKTWSGYSRIVPLPGGFSYFLTPTRSPSFCIIGGGTAKAVDAVADDECEAIAISDLIASVGDVALLKVDIDGFDIEVISGAFGGTVGTGIQSPTYPIYFELEFTGSDTSKNRSRCERALEFFQKAAAAGYITAFLWDDPGRFFGLNDLRDPTGIINAINYMLHLGHRPVWGFDICLVHQSDAAFASELCTLISSEVVLPLPVSPTSRG
jgi:hypothetical protein